MITPKRARTGERGSVPLETAVLAPAILLIIGLIVQAGFWFHARDVAIAAAEEGARAAAYDGAGASNGRSAAADFASRVGRGALKDVAVSATRGATTATVTVTGHSISLVPGLTFTIQQSASVPTERITR
ncbi:MAG: pilus assembly protein [Actinobacteria bacterium]|nr:pilus assembly protein [Actinomycetota bacterium]